MSEGREYVTNNRYGKQHARDCIHRDTRFEKDVTAGRVLRVIFFFFASSLSAPSPHLGSTDSRKSYRSIGFQPIMYPFGRCEASHATTSEMS